VTTADQPQVQIGGAVELPADLHPPQPRRLPDWTVRAQVARLLHGDDLVTLLLGLGVIAAVCAALVGLFLTAFLQK
jgi:hypothetical protein